MEESDPILRSLHATIFFSRLLLGREQGSPDPVRAEHGFRDENRATAVANDLAEQPALASDTGGGLQNAVDWPLNGPLSTVRTHAPWALSEMRTEWRWASMTLMVADREETGSGPHAEEQP
jgi:hypothetical protein